MRTIGIITIGLLATLAVASPAAAVVPDLIPVQGVLTNDVGDVVDGFTDLSFRLYDDEFAATALWSESYTGPDQVDVEGGLFTVYLGSVVALDFAVLLAAGELWLGITVGTDDEMDRVRLAAVPFAQQCRFIGEFEADDLQPRVNIGGDTSLGVCGAGEVVKGIDPVTGAITCVVDQTEGSTGGEIMSVNGIAPIQASTSAGGHVDVSVNIGSTASTVAAGDHLHTGVYSPITHTHGVLFRGSGLTGSNYNGSTATTWAVNFGTTSGTAAEGHHLHAGVYAPTTHSHSAADITSGTLAAARGGTGMASYTAGNYINASNATTLQQRTPSQVLSDIGAAAATHNHDTTYVNRTGDSMSGSLAITTSGTVDSLTINNNHPDGNLWGISSTAASTSGRGINGAATATTGATYGVWGQSASTTGRGVYGVASAGTGENYGVYGETNSAFGWAGYFQGRVNVTGDLIVGGTVHVSPKTRYVHLGPADFASAAKAYNQIGSAGGNANYQITNATATTVNFYVPTRAPTGRTVSRVDCLVQQSSAGIITLYIYNSSVSAGSVTSGATTGSSFTMSITGLDVTPTQNSRGLPIRFSVDLPAGGTVYLYQCSLTYTESSF